MTLPFVSSAKLPTAKRSDLGCNDGSPTPTRANITHGHRSRRNSEGYTSTAVGLTNVSASHNVTSQGLLSIRFCRDECLRLHQEPKWKATDCPQARAHADLLATGTNGW
jgi:hypothetical protein